MHVPADFNGSMFTGGGGDGAADMRTVPVTTLDILTEETGCRGPYILKSDTEGAELQILRGATRVLEETEMVILEVAFFPFSGRPQFQEMTEFMHQRGFVLYDLYDQVYRPLDGALGLADAAFVRESGRFRASHAFRTPEQKQANLAKKLRYREEELRRIGNSLS
jgi:hypothetical protein